jgi:hypothetical protein
MTQSPVNQLLNLPTTQQTTASSDSLLQRLVLAGCSPLYKPKPCQKPHSSPNAIRKCYDSSPNNRRPVNSRLECRLGSICKHPPRHWAACITLLVTDTVTVHCCASRCHNRSSPALAGQHQVQCAHFDDTPRLSRPSTQTEQPAASQNIASPSAKHSKHTAVTPQ